MVIDNVFNQPTPESRVQNSTGSLLWYEGQLASPLNRLAAAIVDLSIILMPLVLLLGAPIKKIILSAVLIQDDSLFVLSVFSLAMLALVTVVSYQTVFLYFFQATLGKKIFGLKVVPIWADDSLPLFSIFLRSLLWTFESMLLFLPHLSIFSDPRRRPIHDRLANTIVVQTAKSVIAPPSVYEITFVKSITAMFVALLALAAVKSALGFFNNLDQNNFLAKFNTSSQLCEEVDWAMDSWPTAEAELDDGRLYVALALFASGEANKDCLKTEVNHYQAKVQKESGIAYLSQAFVNSANSELSNRYLKRICETDPYSANCAMARIVENWSEASWADVDLGFMSLSANPPLHMAIWAIRHYTRQRQYEKAHHFIEQVSPQRALSSFLSQYRVKVLWGLHRKAEVRAVASTALENLEIEDRMELGSWLCQKEYQDKECRAFATASCQVVSQDLAGTHETAADVDMGLLLALQQKCGMTSDDTEFLTETYLSDEVKDYFQAVTQIQQGQERSAHKLLSEIKDNEQIDGKVRLFAEADWVETAEPAVLEERSQKWQGESVNEDWAYLGTRLARRLSHLNQNQKALEIVSLVREKGFDDEFVLRVQVVSLFKLSQMREAYQHLKELERRDSGGLPVLSTPSRGLASESKQVADDFDRAVAELNKWAFREGLL